MSGRQPWVASGRGLHAPTAASPGKAGGLADARQGLGGQRACLLLRWRLIPPTLDHFGHYGMAGWIVALGGPRGGVGVGDSVPGRGDGGHGLVVDCQVAQIEGDCPGVCRQRLTAALEGSTAEIVPGAGVDPPGVGGLGIPQALGDGPAASRSLAESSRSCCGWAVLARIDQRSSSVSTAIGDYLKSVKTLYCHEFYLSLISSVEARSIIAALSRSRVLRR